MLTSVSAWKGPGVLDTLLEEGNKPLSSEARTPRRVEAGRATQRLAWVRLVGLTSLGQSTAHPGPASPNQTCCVRIHGASPGVSR